MSGSYLLDTNAAIAFLGGDVALTDFLAAEDLLFVSVTVMGELFLGAEKSTRYASNRRRLDSLLELTELLVIDLRTADVYGQIRCALEDKGRPIPENDIWIAAVAMQYRLPVLTRDKHFQEVDGVKAIAW